NAPGRPLAVLQAAENNAKTRCRRCLGTSIARSPDRPEAGPGRPGQPHGSAGAPGRWRDSLNRQACGVGVGVLFAVDGRVALVFLYFFLVGIADGSVSSFNIVLWLAILAGLAVVLVGGPALRAHGRRAAANALLLVLAIPGFLGGLFVLALIVLQPRWN